MIALCSLERRGLEYINFSTVSNFKRKINSKEFSIGGKYIEMFLIANSSIFLLKFRHCIVNVLAFASV